MLSCQVYNNNDEPITALIDIPIINDAYFNANSIAQLKIPQTTPKPENPNDQVPLRLFDPGYKNTIVCKSKVSKVDPHQGKLYYRGYDVEELVDKSNFLEVAYLLVHGSLPNAKEYHEWSYKVMHHTYLHTELSAQMTCFRYDAHPYFILFLIFSSIICIY